jgi:hypothetical protein
MRLIELLQLLALAPLLIRRFRKGGFPPPSSLRMGSLSSYRREKRDEVEPQGWLLARDEIRVLYGTTPEGQWLKFSYYGDDLGIIYHTSAPQALEAIRCGYWTVVGTEAEALKAGRKLAMEQAKLWLLELLA